MTADQMRNAYHTICREIRSMEMMRKERVRTRTVLALSILFWGFPAWYFWGGDVLISIIVTASALSALDAFLWNGFTSGIYEQCIESLDKAAGCEGETSSGRIEGDPHRFC